MVSCAMGLSNTRYLLSQSSSEASYEALDAHLVQFLLVLSQLLPLVVGQDLDIVRQLKDQDVRKLDRRLHDVVFETLQKQPLCHEEVLTTLSRHV